MRIAILAFLISLPAAAQWFNQPDPRLVRGKDGKPILTANAPRTPDGKPDLTGLWVRREGESAPPNTAGLGFSLQWWMPKGAEIPLRPAFAAVYKERAARDGGGRPSERCLPHGIPGAMLPPTPFKFVQAPGVTLILYENWLDFRQIFTDGRAHPKSMNPAWYGYSIGKWVGDTFAVETTGFNEESWLDGLGLPHSDQLRVTERFQRLTAGRLQMEGTIDDPKMYTKPWTFKVDFNLIADGDIIEYLCENEKDAAHQIGAAHK
ncbi:MAG: hypothetical protein EXQ47_10235 [Bryobacterales bacterium]|nr:hypothetical protein [Bryobacterales bacterium]